MQGQWLRFFDTEGRWLPSQADLLAEETRRAERERQRAEHLAARLRALGLSPDEE